MPIDNNATPKILSDIYRENIRKNLNFIVSKGLSQNKIAKSLKDKGLDINQGTISKYLSGQMQIPLSFIVKFCEIYNISIVNLASNTYTDINSNSENNEAKKTITTAVTTNLGENFILSPHNEAFRGYIQPYFCYFFPTLSNEEKILTGELELFSDDNFCKATLKLRTNKVHENKPVYKYYNGYAILSKAVNSCYILLSSDEEGELNFINFRYFRLRHHLLDCRMAEVLTTGAGERHFPTIHRMLLSRLPIKEKTLQHLYPHLYLNNSKITIEERALKELKNLSEPYKAIIDHLLLNISPIPTYHLRENFVLSTAEQFLPKKETHLFVSTMREKSYKIRYNKVSNKLDEIVHNLLISEGYYNDDISDNSK